MRSGFLPAEPWSQFYVETHRECVSKEVQGLWEWLSKATLTRAATQDFMA